MEIAEILGSMLGNNRMAGMTIDVVNSAGFFRMAMGGMMAAMGSLIGHVLYGGILGAIAGAPETRLVGA